jgi:hypothetical protein
LGLTIQRKGYGKGYDTRRGEDDESLIPIPMVDLPRVKQFYFRENIEQEGVDIQYVSRRPKLCIKTFG